MIVQDSNRIPDQLLLSLQNSPFLLQNSLYHMFRMLKGLDPRIINANQIRQSVIEDWSILAAILILIVFLIQC